MRTINFELNGNDKLLFNKPLALALGGFDSMHVGHAALIKAAKEDGKDGNCAVMLLQDTLSESVLSEYDRFALLEGLGVDIVFVLKLTNEVKSVGWQSFLNCLSARLSINEFVCGFDFRFGANAVGDVQSLREYCVKNSIKARIISQVTFEGKKASTTLVKSLLKSGETIAANRLLGYNFGVSGVVEHDRGVGGSLGFPTANFDYPDDIVKIKQGVYAAYVEYDNKKCKAVVNFGSRPTFDVLSERVEVHLIDKTEALYSKTIRVTFIKYLRKIIRFEDANALAAQIGKDVSAAKIALA